MSIYLNGAYNPYNGEYNPKLDIVYKPVLKYQTLEELDGKFGNPIKDDEFFAGYFLRSDLTRKMQLDERFDINLNIFPKSYPVKITYNLVGGKWGEVIGKNFLELTELPYTLPTPIKEGYHFDGWTPSSSITAAGQFTVTATWKED